MAWGTRLIGFRVYRVDRVYGAYRVYRTYAVFSKDFFFFVFRV